MNVTREIKNIPDPLLTRLFALIALTSSLVLFLSDDPLEKYSKTLENTSKLIVNNNEMTSKLFFISSKTKMMEEMNYYKSSNLFRSINFASVKDLNFLREMFLFELNPKTFFQKNFKIFTFKKFFKQIIFALNIKEKINVNNLWLATCASHYDEVYIECCEYYYDQLQKYFSEDKPRKREILFRLLMTLREEVNKLII